MVHIPHHHPYPACIQLHSQTQWWLLEFLGPAFQGVSIHAISSLWRHCRAHQIITQILRDGWYNSYIRFLILNAK